MVPPRRLAPLACRPRMCGFAFGAAIAVVAGAGACSDDLGPPLCAASVVTLPATPLSLLSRARLDRVDTGFVLIGADGDTVRWMRLSATGQAGPVASIEVPRERVGGPWFAVAGRESAGDTVIVAYTVAAAAGAPVGTVSLVASAVPFVGGGAATAAQPVAVVPDARLRSVQMVMAGGRSGRQAAIAWGERGSTTISALVLSGDGTPAAAPLDLGRVGDFDCLRFSPGTGDLTVGYVDLSSTPPRPRFVLTELDANGAVSGSQALSIGERVPGCVELVPSDMGYALAWHNEVGTYLGVYDRKSAAFRSSLVVGDVRLSGGPPTLGALGWTGRDYALLFDRRSGGEVWRLTPFGERRGGGLLFPSMRGHVGQAASQPVGSSLVSTYADYFSADPANEQSGQRFFVTVTCP